MKEQNLFKNTNNIYSMIIFISTMLLAAVPSGLAASFLKEPRNTSVAQGEDGVLECIFDAPVSSCYWNKDDSNVEIGNGRYQWAQRSYASGPTSPDCTLKISGTQIELDDGAWECGTPQTDRLKGVHSTRAFFTVMIPPSEPVILLNGIEQANETSIPVDVKSMPPPKITCISSMGNPPAILTWQLDNSPVSGMMTLTDTPTNTIKRVELNITQTIDESWKERRLTCNSQHPMYSSQRPGTTTERHFNYVYIKMPNPTSTVTALSRNGTSTETTISMHINDLLIFNCTSDGFPVPQYRWERREDDNGQWQFFRDGQNISFQAFSSQFQCVATPVNGGTDIRSQIITVNTNAKSAQVGLIIGILVFVLLLIVALVAVVFTLYKQKKWPFIVPKQQQDDATVNNALAPEVEHRLESVPEESEPVENKKLIESDDRPTNGEKENGNSVNKTPITTETVC